LKQRSVAIRGGKEKDDKKRESISIQGRPFVKKKKKGRGRSKDGITRDKATGRKEKFYPEKVGSQVWMNEGAGQGGGRERLKTPQRGSPDA